jgi:hypothetical protein
LEYKAKVLHLEKEKVKLSQEKTKLLNRDIVVPYTTKEEPNTEGLVQAMSQVILKEG